ncbi:MULTISPECIES: HAD family hydrolase [Halostella]|uniref:HAD family hydrolase n=1 Tax=Halostella TaxID=1843185 RepID=UPI001081CDC1|nr:MULTISPECIES: HAD family hydrolase [Halostella]
MEYDAILFDHDGVLVEGPSRESIVRAGRETLRSFAVDVPASNHLDTLKSGDVSEIARFCRDHGIDTMEFCYRAARNSAREQYRELESGARTAYADVSALRSLDVPLGVVSDNQPAVVEQFLRSVGLYDLFDTIRGCTYDPWGIERQKPDPYHIETALDELDADAAAYVGDRGVDIAAANRAGVDAVLVDRDGDAPDAPAATARIESVAELPDALR